ncbi:MAG: AraC family transcriptional regulator [Verrucomicrobiales bacterium]|nr:AraC family transcriptional regulator [Verrucomicrobiae bacterium]MCP5553243.1 AraC family transcriptional regulator [Akkermansiaceae bacterium]
MANESTHPDPVALRDAFLRAIAPGHYFRMFDCLPGILFFAKDPEGRLLAANLPLIRHYGRATEAEFIGLTDFDLLPRSLAEKFRQDDLQVMATGQPLLDIVEIFVKRQGIPGWFVTNKMPVFDHDGKVIGVMGTIQEYETQEDLLPTDSDLQPVLAHISTHFHQALPVRDLAAMAGLSVRQFERRFKEQLKTGPQEFIIKMRVYAACDLLRRTRRPIVEIGTDLGFYDQSAFTRHFRRTMGITPLQYRKTYR